MLGVFALVVVFLVYKYFNTQKNNDYKSAVAAVDTSVCTEDSSSVKATKTATTTIQTLDLSSSEAEEADSIADSSENNDYYSEADYSKLKLIAVKQMMTKTMMTAVRAL